MALISSSSSEQPPLLRPNLLPSIDLSSLSQSELHSLSLLSNPPTPNLTTTTTTSQLNPSLFNQSSSTTNQTFSDPRRLHKRPLLRRERSESSLIVNLLKNHLHPHNSDNNHPRPTKKRKRRKDIGEEGNDEEGNGVEEVVDLGAHPHNSKMNNPNKKRNRKRSESEVLREKGIGEQGDEEEENVSVEIVNRNGEVVDLAALKEENEGGPFGEELRRRAAGMESEEKLLEMLAAMEGKWCSRRMKRRVVKACLLGDALPVGWKVIIALKRKEGKFYPYCRRYISPTGEELASCKEVSSYLQSYFGINDTSVLRDRRDAEEHQDHQQRVDSDKPMTINSEDGNCMLDIPSSTVSNVCVPIEPEKEISVLGIDNLPDVQVSDLYECRPCNVSFDVKDKYLQHLMSFHQKTTRKYRLGSSVGAGVIIRDGKFECQFCHKVFEERRRYLGHVGNHVRGSAKRSEVSVLEVMGTTKPSCKEQMPTNGSISRMDALIEVVQTSIQDVSPSSVGNVGEASLVENSAGMDADCQIEKCSSAGLCENGSTEGKSLHENSNPQDGPSEILEACPDDPGVEKNSEQESQDNASTEEPNPPCDTVSEISMADRDIVKDSIVCIDEPQADKVYGKHVCSFEELNPQDEVREISMSNGNMTCPSEIPTDLEMEGKTLPEILNHCDEGIDGERNEQSFTFETTIVPPQADKVDDKHVCSFEEMNPQDEVREISMSNGNMTCPSEIPTDLEMESKTLPEILNHCDEGIDGERNEQSFTFETTIVPPTEIGLHAENTSGNIEWEEYAADENNISLDEPKGMLGLDYLLYNEKASPVDGAEEMTNSNGVAEQELERAQDYDVKELGAVYGSSPFDEILEKERQNMSSLEQNLGSVMRSEYMKLDEAETQMYSAMAGEEFVSLSAISMGFEISAQGGLGLDAQCGSHSEFAMDIARESATPTVCVWCCTEFTQRVIDIEVEPDTVGFMCPTCRNKISKQFNGLETNFLDHHYY